MFQQFQHMLRGPWRRLDKELFSNFLFFIIDRKNLKIINNGFEIIFFKFCQFLQTPGNLWQQVEMKCIIQFFYSFVAFDNWLQKNLKSVKKVVFNLFIDVLTHLKI